jgi:hypothetical protein
VIRTQSALHSIAEVTEEQSMWAAYNRVLFAVGNNHAGVLYAAALPAVARVAAYLNSESAWVRRTAGEILTELLAFEFHPDFAPELKDSAEASKRAQLLPFKEDLIRAIERVGRDERAGIVFNDLMAELDGDRQ